MHPKKIWQYPLALTVLCCSITHTLADVVDPVTALKDSAHFHSGQTLYQWEADVNGDGRKEVFLDTVEDYDTIDKHGKNIPTWYVYLQNASKSGYVVWSGVVIPELGPEVGPTGPQIDPERTYIGPISQLGKLGIVTIQTDYAKDLPAVAYISAYTIEGDHLRETLLAKYDPTKGKNAIYEQYLSKAHRTTVKLEKITVP